MGVVVVYGTTYVQLVHMCWPLLWGRHQIGRSFGGSVFFLDADFFLEEMFFLS